MTSALIAFKKRDVKAYLDDHIREAERRARRARSDTSKAAARTRTDTFQQVREDLFGERLSPEG